MAHALGMGKYVPTTAVISHDEFYLRPEKEWHGPQGNHYSVMEKVPEAVHWSNTPEQAKMLADMYHSGDLHKLAVMNAIFCNTDRHGSNWMMSPKGLHLIDHGLTFDYHNPERTFFTPSYLETGLRAATGKDYNTREKLHPEAEKWLVNMDLNKIMDTIDSHKMHPDFKNAIARSLLAARDKALDGKPISMVDLFRHIVGEGRNWKKKPMDDYAEEKLAPKNLRRSLPR